MFAVTALATVAALTLSACASTEDGTQSTVTPTHTTTATTSPTGESSTAEGTTGEESEPSTTEATPDTRAATSLLGRPDTERKTSEPEGDWGLVPIDVRVGAHEGFDRAVIEFEGGGTPGWFVDYTPEPRQQASGLPIEFEGEGAINVIITGVPYPFDSEVPEDEWIQVGAVAGEAGAITGVSHDTIFEGQAQFTIGLADGEAPFSVTLLEEPTRVVIDVQHTD